MFKKMLVASIFAATAIAAPALADATAPTSQPATNAARRHPLDQIREALEQLNLSTDQKEHIHKIVEDAPTQIKPILESAKAGDRENAREEIRTIVKDTLKKISALLTEEQKEKLHTLIHEERTEAQK
jgi:Spy/CpxP family protein refolding chaperone